MFRLTTSTEHEYRASMADIPQLAGNSFVAVPAHQQVSPMQIPVLKLTRLLCHCQAQGRLQAANMCGSATARQEPGVHITTCRALNLSCK